jgi:uncharacterized protein (DUF362 family)
MYTTYVKGITKNTSEDNLEAILETFILQVLDNLNWLKSGETVLIKVVMNSPDAYPATTHPLAAKVLARLVQAKGGIPVIGDQSGVEYVVHTPNGILRGSSHECFKKTGLAKINANIVAFEDENWNSFTHFKDPQAANWPDGFYVTPWIEKADHIVSLPRISTHAQSGITLGAKSWVGILRQDSRMLFHAQGPFNAFINFHARGANLRAKKQSGLDFFEMIAEIQLAIAKKLRGTIFVATELQTTMGPNKFLFSEYGVKLFKTHIAKPEIGLLIGSQDPVAADAIALAFLFDCYEQTPWIKKILQKFLILQNGQIREPGSYNVWSNPFIMHGLNLGLGTRFNHPNALVVDDAGEPGKRLINLTK